MRQTAEFFGEAEMELVYITKKLNDARRLEELLTAEGIDYLVEADKYHGGVIFRTQRVGAFFYVLPEALQAAEAVLGKAGFQGF